MMVHARELRRQLVASCVRTRNERAPRKGRELTDPIRNGP